MDWNFPCARSFALAGEAADLALRVQASIVGVRRLQKDGHYSSRASYTAHTAIGSAALISAARGLSLLVEVALAETSKRAAFRSCDRQSRKAPIELRASAPPNDGTTQC